MNINKILGGKIRILAVAIPVLFILFPFGYSAVASLMAGNVNDAPLFLEKADSEFEECVRDATYMRYHHWELLRYVREEVVRYGKRGDISLQKCQDCHKNREKFCDKCHDAVSMTPDCFECHHYP